jgi:hypothetical protein
MIDFSGPHQTDHLPDSINKELPYNPILLFGSIPIDDFFKEVKRGIDVFIDNLEGLSAGSIGRYASEILSDYQIKSILIDPDNFVPGIEIRKVPGHKFPPDKIADKNSTYNCTYVKYSFKINGNKSLIAVKPNFRQMSEDVIIELDGDSFSIGYQTLSSGIDLTQGEITEIKEYIKNIINQLPRMQLAINKEIAVFNPGLFDYAMLKLEKKLKRIDKYKALIDDLRNL